MRKPPLLLVFLVAGTVQLKAQQQLPKSADTTLFKTPNSYNPFKSFDNDLFKNPLNQIQSKPLLSVHNSKTVEATAFYSRMPIAKLTSDDKMPVARLDGNDNMLIKKVKVVDPMVVSPPAIP